jgi:hypothetical protein
MNVLPVLVEWIGRCLARKSEEGIAKSRIQIRSMSGDIRIWTHDKRYHVRRETRLCIGKWSVMGSIRTVWTVH